MYIPEDYPIYGNLSISEQMLQVDLLVRQGKYMQALSASVLLCNVVLQVRVPESIIRLLVEASFTPLDTTLKKLGLHEERAKKPFPLKPVKEAGVKVNVSFSDVYESLLELRPVMAQQVEYYSGSMQGLFNDQAAAVVLAAGVLQPFYVDAVAIAIQMARSMSEAKALTTIIKGAGLQINRIGAVIVEAQSLHGKGMNDVNMREEVIERIGKAGLKKTPQLFSDKELRSSIRKVLAIELPGMSVKFEDTEDWWSRRWGWCANGGHSRQVERKTGDWKVNLMGRVHRRVAMESWSNNPLYFWNGEVYVSSAIKEENGKQRLILSCDTVSYACFEHFVKPIEKEWANNRVLLNPAEYGLVGITEKVKGMGKGVNVMLDYTDYNAQHTLRAQEIVVEEVAQWTGYDPVLTKRLCASFYRMHACVDGEELGLFSATLMSGHRLTTFINSILNLAYIIAADPALWDSKAYDSLHTGDDVVAVFHSPEDVEVLLNKLEAAKVKLNPLKQSVGCVTKEFLRLAIGDKHAIGYAMRAVASCVSGNWSSDGLLGVEGIMTTMVTNCRSLINRSGHDLPALLLVRSVAMKTGFAKKVVEALLTGKASLGKGPVFQMNGSNRPVFTMVSTPIIDEDMEYGELDCNATNAFQANHVSSVEHEILNELNFSVFNSMLGASYAKSLAENDTRVTAKVVLKSSHDTSLFAGNVCVKEIYMRKRAPGVLEAYPILSMLKPRLTTRHLKVIFKKLSISYKGDIEQAAWGKEARSILVVGGVLPYGEAASMSQKTTASIVTVTYSIYM